MAHDPVSSKILRENEPGHTQPLITKHHWAFEELGLLISILQIRYFRALDTYLEVDRWKPSWLRPLAEFTKISRNCVDHLVGNDQPLLVNHAEDLVYLLTVCLTNCKGVTQLSDSLGQQRPTLARQ